MISVTSREVFRILTCFRRSLIPKQAEGSFYRTWSMSTSKAFSLIFVSRLLVDSLLDWPPDTVEKLEHLSFELPLTLMITFRYSDDLLHFNAANSSRERAAVLPVEGAFDFLAASEVWTASCIPSDFSLSSVSFSSSPSSYLFRSSTRGMSNIERSSSYSSSSSETSLAWSGMYGEASLDLSWTTSSASSIFMSSWTLMMGCSFSSRS